MENIAIVLTVLMQTFLIIVMNHYIYILDNPAALKMLLPFINLLMILLISFLLISIKKLENNARRKVEINLLRDHLKQIESLLFSMQTQKHDHTKHIQTLQAMIHLGEIAEAEKYIDGIAESYWYMQDIINVGHPALTALLNSKRKVAEIKKIEFDFSVKCDVSQIHIPSWDLCSIIANLLDNAFEAVTGNNGHKRVGMEIKLEDHLYQIYVYNNGPRLTLAEKRRIFDLGYTTKDSIGRGYGLYLVQKLVQNYQGEIQIISEDKTTFIVSIPRKEKEYD
ncbi:MAG: sensor histidine kinase [Peptococcaceae bacterium]